MNFAMDSSSIVSFNNDSTYQTTLKVNYNNASVYEMALRAMRDRCLVLQRRINTLESDNMRLKLDSTKEVERSSFKPLPEDEKLTLRRKIAELNKQKSQLLHHVFMVSCENKNLWNKLSTLSGNEKLTKEHTKQPLIRTNTYIHSTPKYNIPHQEKFSDSSLEEISLKFINSYIQEKSQLVEQYEQMAQLQGTEDDVLNVDSLGFTYLEDPATDSLKEIHAQTEKLQNLKKELGQQEKQLKMIVSRIETIMKEGYKCTSCRGGKSTSYVNKETETSSSLTVSPHISSTPFKEELDKINELEQEENIQPFDKMCPMCGEKFQKDTEFSDFQSHVENHFVGDNEAESIENFDTIPNSFDNAI